MRYDKSKYMIIIYMWPVNPESYLLGSCAKLVHFHRVSNAQRTFTLHAQNIKRKGKNAQSPSFTCPYILS